MDRDKGSSDQEARRLSHRAESAVSRFFPQPSFGRRHALNPATTARARSAIGLMREDHREVSEHREQDARDGIGDRETDPGHRAVDLDCRLAARAGVRARAGHAAHQHRRIDLEEVVADRPDDERRDRAGDEADDEDLQRDRAGELREQACCRR